MVHALTDDALIRKAPAIVSCKSPFALAENKETLTDKHAVVVDQRIVSSMFLPSAASVAEEMVRLLERESPDARCEDLASRASCDSSDLI
jgi:hypothetical protein